MSPAFAVESNNLATALRVLGNVTSADMKVIIKQEAKMFLKHAIKLTYPVNEAQGVAALNRDIHRAVRLVTPNFKSESINEVIRKRDVSAWNVLSKNFKGGTDSMKGTQAAPFSPDLHKRSRAAINWRMRRPRGNSKTVTFDAQAYTAYAHKAAQRVGRLKSGWSASFHALGLKQVSYIERHSERYGGCKVTDTPDKTAYAMANKTDYSPGYASQIKTALTTREAVVMRNVQRVLMGQATNLGFVKLAAKS